MQGEMYIKVDAAQFLMKNGFIMKGERKSCNKTIRSLIERCRGQFKYRTRSQTKNTSNEFVANKQDEDKTKNYGGQQNSLAGGSD